MIHFFRELLYYFLMDNKHKEIFGLQLEQAIIGDADSFEDYCTKIVREMDIEAQSLLLPILPSILRIKIRTIILDTHAKVFPNVIIVK